jgi:hypothetical protein
MSTFETHGTDFYTLVILSSSLYFVIPRSPCPRVTLSPYQKIFDVGDALKDKVRLH